MVKWRYPLIIATLLGLVAMAAAVSNGDTVQNSEANESFLQKSIMLPSPNIDGGIFQDKTPIERRSIRTLKNIL
jgi:hypothetical protein